jgi:hypothetical protein
MENYGKLHPARTAQPRWSDQKIETETISEPLIWANHWPLPETNSNGK